MSSSSLLRGVASQGCELQEAACRRDRRGAEGRAHALEQVSPARLRESRPLDPGAALLCWEVPSAGSAGKSVGEGRRRGRVRDKESCRGG